MDAVANRREHRSYSIVLPGATAAIGEQCTRLVGHPTSGFGFLQHQVRRLLSGLVVRHGKSECVQVETRKQGLAAAEYDWRQRKMQGIHQPSLKVLTQGGNTAADFDVLIARRLLGEP